MITNGATEAINLALRAVTRPGDTVAVESPTFYGLLQILESLNLRVLEVPASTPAGFTCRPWNSCYKAPNASRR